MSLTAEQLAVRKTRVGASEIGALVDYYAPRPDGERVDPHKTAFDVWANKDAPPEQEEHQQWGLDIEEAILTNWTRRQEMTLARPVPTLVHPTIKAICATPDGFGIKGTKVRNLQAKNAQFHQMYAWGDEGSDNVPLLYVAQVTMEMGIILAQAKDGRLAGDFEEESDVVACLGGAPPKGFPVRCDPELLGNLTTLAEKFKRDHLDPGKAPEVTLHSADSAAEWIRRKYPTQTGPLLDPTDEARELVRLVEMLRETGSTTDKEKKLAEAKLKLLLKDAEGIHGLCTFRQNKDSIGPDWELIARSVAIRAGGIDLDEMARKPEFQAVQKGARVLRITENTDPKPKKEKKRNAA